MLQRFTRLVQKVGCQVDVIRLPGAALHTYMVRRYFFKYLNRALNLYDCERIQVVGADRLCAEWVLKCGGRVRWTNSGTWLSDYNSLPPETTEVQLNVQDVDVSGTVVMSEGFQHLWNLKDLKSLKLHDCKYLDDNSLHQLRHTALSLQQLQISANSHITDKGLLSLVELINLTDLHLKDLPKVQDKKEVYEKLQNALPDCDIIYPDVDSSIAQKSE